MLAGDFQANLRKCNRNLRIFCGDDGSKPAGIFHVVNGEYTEICGIDKHWLPEWPLLNEKGKYLKGGWRRAMRMLITVKLVDRRVAERVFGTQIMGTRKPELNKQWKDPIEAEILAAQAHNMLKTGRPTLKRDEIMDLASEINKQEGK